MSKTCIGHGCCHICAHDRTPARCVRQLCGSVGSNGQSQLGRRQYLAELGAICWSTTLTAFIHSLAGEVSWPTRDKAGAIVPTPRGPLLFQCFLAFFVSESFSSPRHQIPAPLMQMKRAQATPMERRPLCFPNTLERRGSITFISHLTTVV